MDTSAARRQAMTDEQWLAALKRSAVEGTVDGIRFPGFPPKEVQERFVGSSFATALDEAFNFYSLVKMYGASLSAPINQDSVFLDFGMGWGRYTRLFWKDIPEYNLYGVDVHPDMINLCHETNVPGTHYKIDHDSILPFADGVFTVIIAYSVFTYLPEPLHRHWLAELSRVAATGCLFVLTVEPPRFIDFCANISDNAESSWHQALASHVGDGVALKARIDKSEYVYLPTGGGDHLPSDIYGDCVIPKSYIIRNWSPLFEVRDYIDDPQRFWQAVVVLQKR